MFEAIKNQFLTEFTGEFSMSAVLIALLISFIVGLIVLAVYKITFEGTFFSKRYAFDLVLSTMITAVIIATINSNLALSLGMVGALSIVRFRTAVKDPNDTIFMFWTVAAGIMVGAKLYFVAVIASVLMGILFVVLWLCGVKFGKKPSLLIIRYQNGKTDEIKKYLSAFPSRKVKSKTATEQYVEVIFECSPDNKSYEALDALNSNSAVISASLVQYKGEFS